MESIRELKGKNCIFFGANDSFGRELCKNIAKVGLNLGLIDFDHLNSSDLSKNLKNIGVKSISATVIPGKATSFEKAVAKIIEYFGDLDFLICAYYFDEDISYENDKFHIDKLSMEKWDDNLLKWVGSYFLMIKSVLPHMLNKNRGKIIFTNLTSGYTGEGEGEGQLSGTSSLYFSACSSAITGMMTSIAREIIPLGVKVNGIALNPTLKRDDNRILNAFIFLFSDISYYTCGQIIRLY